MSHEERSHRPRAPIVNLRQLTLSDPQGSAQDVTLTKALEAWYSSKTGRPWTVRTASDVRFFGRGWIRDLGDIGVRRIRSFEVESLYAQRDDGSRANGSLNLERKWIRAFWHWLQGHELVDHDPLRFWPKLPDDPVWKPTELPRDREAAWLQFLATRIFRASIFMLYSSVRIGECYAVLWGWIVPDRLNAGQWLLRLPGKARKVRKELVLALSQKAVEVLGPRGADDQRVFPELPSKSRFRELLARAGEAVGVMNLKPHDLRRTWSARLAEAGVSILMQKEIGGWKEIPTIAKAYYPPVPHRIAREHLDRM